MINGIWHHVRTCVKGPWMVILDPDYALEYAESKKVLIERLECQEDELDSFLISLEDFPELLKRYLI